MFLVVYAYDPCLTGWYLSKHVIEGGVTYDVFLIFMLLELLLKIVEGCFVRIMTVDDNRFMLLFKQRSIRLQQCLSHLFLVMLELLALYTMIE